VIIPAILGRCEEAEQKARAWAATMPEHPAGFYNLATILDGRGRPTESVEELFKTVADRMRPSQRDYGMAWDHAKLAIAHGQFDEAERRLADADRFAPARGEAGIRSGLVNTLARVYLEEGRPREAGEIADALIKRESALTPTNLPSWHGITFDPMLLVASIAAHYGSLPKDELDKRRAAWLAEQAKVGAKRVDKNLSFALWAYAWVETAETPEEAKAALAKFDGELTPVLDTFAETLVDVGRVHLLGGDAAGAVPLLKRAVRNCQPLDHALALVRAHALLGEALEATGDKAGARAEYDALLARWGSAKPKSVTADKVKARRKALGN
jgi:serine/threonine-protein kinase